MIAVGLAMIVWRRRGAKDVDRCWGITESSMLAAIAAMYALGGALLVVFGVLRLFKP